MTVSLSMQSQMGIATRGEPVAAVTLSSCRYHVDPVFWHSENWSGSRSCSRGIELAWTGSIQYRQEVWPDPR